MPKIAEYNNQATLSGQPFESAAYSMERYGALTQRVIEQTGQQLERGIGTAEKHIEQSETTDAAMKLADFNTQAFSDYQKFRANADPNNPDNAKNFIENYIKPGLEKLRGNYMTAGANDMIDKASANATKEWFDRTASDQAQQAADAASNSVKMVGDSITSAVYNDPTALDGQLASGAAVIAGIYKAHGVPQAETDKAIDDMTKKATYTSFLGKIDRNPTEALKELSDPQAGGGHLTGEQLAELRDKSVTETRMRIALAKDADAQQREDNRRGAEGTVGSILQQGISPDGKFRVSPQMIATLRNPIFNTPEGAEVKKETLGWLLSESRARAEAEQPSDPHTFEVLRQRASLPESDPNHLTVSDLLPHLGDGSVNSTDGNRLSRIMDLSHDQATKGQMKQFHDNLSSLKSSITQSNPLAGINHVHQDQMWSNFQRDMMDEWMTGDDDLHRRMLDPRDPQSMYQQARKYQLSEDQAERSLQSAINDGTVGVVTPPAYGRDYKPASAAAGHGGATVNVKGAASGFEPGKVYRDANGNRARYNNGQWEPVQ